MFVALSFVGALPAYIIECIHQIRCYFDKDIYLIINDIESQYIDHLEKYNVIIVLSPYHPKLYQEMKNEKNIIVDIEKDFMNFEKKITIVGSYDPLKLGCEDKDLYDGLHPKSSCMEKIFLSLNILK